MSALVARLVDQGLVHRGSDPQDARVVLLSLTPAGEGRSWRSAAPPAPSGSTAALAGLPPDDVARIADAVPALTRLADALRRPAEGGDPVSSAAGSSMFKQPKAVYAVAFACVVSFMGIGLVDPILPALSPAAGRHAEPGHPAVHQLPRRHRGRDARSPAGSPAGSAPSAP